MNTKITWAELALTKPRTLTEGVNVYSSSVGGIPVKQVVMSTITKITFTSNCVVLPLQAMGSLTHKDSDTMMSMGEMHSIAEGTVYTPSMAFSTIIIIGEGDITHG